MAKVLELPAEQRIVLREVSWETYERLLADHEDRRVPRFAYDRGMLEVLMPSPEHENIAYFIALLVAVVAEEMNVNAYGLGSTTFRREDLERGFEPYACFYVENEERVRGKKRLDLTVDPPPDLVIEVDITSPSLSKFPIYARLGVPEVWRYDGERVAIFELRGVEGYAEVSRSVALPPLTGAVIAGFVERSASLGSAEWMREVRRWAREHGGSRNG